MHKDVLGREFQKHDLVMRLSKFSIGVIPCLVTKITKHRIILNGTIICKPERLVIVSDQISVNGVDRWSSSLMAKYGTL